MLMNSLSHFTLYKSYIKKLLGIKKYVLE